MVGFEGVVFYLFLLDSVGANVVALFFPKWLKKNHRGFYKHFPLTKGWAFLYLILVLWVGLSLVRLRIV